MPGAAITIREMTTCVMPFTAAFCGNIENYEWQVTYTEQIN